jgi:hypothetical protein
MEDRRQLLKDVKEYANSDPHTKFVKLLYACIHDLRIKNDTATSEEFLKNQGAISELKLIIRGISIFQKYKEYTGGFDE